MRVTLKKPNEPGLTYNEAIDLLKSLPYNKVRDGEYTIKIDALDLLMLIEATLVKHDMELEEAAVKNAYNDPIKIMGMWGETDECGMGQWLEVNVAPGLNHSAIYKYDRCVRTGM